MADTLIQCFTCSAQFSEPKELQSHIWHYQTEIATAVAKLQQALAHRPSFHSATSEGNPNPGPQDGTRGAFQTYQRQTQDERRAARPTADKNARRSQKCPHRDCHDKRKGYTRPQDLARHYAEHLNVHEFCHFCAKTFQAYQYMKHDCVKTGTGNQRKYTEMRIKALRALTKRELQASNYSKKWRSPVQKNRQRAEHQDDASVISMSTPTHSERPEVDTLPLQPSLPSTDVASAEHGFGTAPSRDAQYCQQNTTSFPMNTEGPFPPNLQFHSTRPLFSPFESGGQSQVQFPAPLWSIWPDRMQEIFWPSGNAPSYGADNLALSQEAIVAPNEPTFEL